MPSATRADTTSTRPKTPDLQRQPEDVVVDRLVEGQVHGLDQERADRVDVLLDEDGRHHAGAAVRALRLSLADGKNVKVQVAMTLWRRPVSGIVTKIRKDAVARSPGAERTNGADCSLAPGPATLAATPPSPRRPGAPTTGVEAPVGRRQPAGDGAERWLRRCGHPVQQSLPTGPGESGAPSTAGRGRRTSQMPPAAADAPARTSQLAAHCRRTGPGPRVGRRQGLADAGSGAECARVALKLEPVEPSLRRNG